MCMRLNRFIVTISLQVIRATLQPLPTYTSVLHGWGCSGWWQHPHVQDCSIHLLARCCCTCRWRPLLFKVLIRRDCVISRGPKDFWYRLARLGLEPTTDFSWGRHATTWPYWLAKHFDSLNISCSMLSMCGYYVFLPVQASCLDLSSVI